MDYEFTTIAVDQVTAADGSYEVLFLGTGRSWIASFFIHISVKYASSQLDPVCSSTTFSFLEQTADS